MVVTTRPHAVTETFARVGSGLPVSWLTDACLHLPVWASVVLGGLSNPPGGLSAWSEGGRPFTALRPLELGGGRAQAHLFGIRHELSTAGQKPAPQSQKAGFGNTPPNV